MPVAPSKLQLKIGNANKTYTLINEGEINVLKSPKLTEITFDLLIPSVKYSFATYKNGQFKPVTYYTELFKKYKTSKKPFQFIVNRTFPNGKILFDTDIKVSLEDYTIKEDANNGLDLIVSIKLKQYRDYKTKICDVDFATTKPKLTVVQSRASGPNEPQTPVTYTVVKGDSLWAIAVKFYGNGAKYTAIAEANKDKIKQANLIYPGQKLVIPDAKNVPTPKSSTTASASTTKKTTKTESVMYGVYTKKGTLLMTFTSYGGATSYRSSHGGEATNLVIKNMSTGQIVT